MRTTRLGFFCLIVLVAASGAAIDLGRISLNGYASVEYELMLSEQGNGDPNGSFDSDLVDLVFNFPVTDEVRAALDVTWEHGAASEDDRGNVALEYGFIEYSFSDLVRVRAGKMFTPFGLFNEIHTAKPAFLTVKEPSSTNKPERIVDNAFRFFPRWGTGIAVQGDGLIGDKSFDYNVLLANGENEDTNPFEEDNNSQKSITGRFRFQAVHFLRVGASFYHDTYSGSDYEDITSYGLEVQVEHGRFQVLAEISQGSLGMAEGDDVSELGWYIQPSYSFDIGLTPYLRYEWIDPDQDVSADGGYDLIVGLNWHVTGALFLKLENNYFEGQEQSSLAQFPGRGYNELKAAVVLGF